FYVGNHHHISSLNANWACEGRGEAVRIQVPATTLDEFCYGKISRPPPNFIKIDIEGGAARALKGAELCLQRARPAILIESHNLEEERAISDCIIRHRYEAMRTEDRQWIASLDNTLPETRQGWGTLLLVPREARKSYSKIL
ncbi:MAG TPA: FkbM family methyltransferase, partial [Verrucomicrobiae bacterium]|nr:FkbM family methyltransferase [Verrucomicrobiae bacterium]